MILVIKSKPHAEFQRRDDDLWMRKKISLNEALCGYTTVIDHLDGRKVVLKSKPGEVIKPEAVRGVIGEGMPNKDSGERGNLYIIFSVEFPENHFLPEGGFQVSVFLDFTSLNFLPLVIAFALQQLEALLPGRPALPPLSADAEEVSLSEFDERRYEESRGGRREAYHDEEDSDEDMHGGGPQRVQCASQ